MAVPTTPTRICSICRAPLLATTIGRLEATGPKGDATFVIFAKSLPVFVCSQCDRAAAHDQPDVVY